MITQAVHGDFKKHKNGYPRNILSHSWLDLNTPEKEIFYHIMEMLDPFSVSIFWQDKNGVVLQCNSHQARLLGLDDPKEVIGKTPFDFFRAQDALKLIEDIDWICKTGKAITREERVAGPELNLYVISTKAPFYNKDHEIAGIIGISFNMTGIKDTEKELEAEIRRLKSDKVVQDQILRSIRHGLITPFNGIVGYAEALRLVVPEAHQERVNILTQSCEQMLSIINQLIETLDIINNDHVTSSKCFSIRLLMDKIYTLYTPLCLKKKLDFEIKIEDEIQEHYWGDEIKIHKILLDLISNAMHFTNHGRIEVKLGTYKKYERETILLFVINDTSPGMDVSNKDVLFGRLRKFSDQETRAGLGLGLWRVKHFIDELKGEIYIQSELGVGTCVQCLIPVRESLWSPTLTGPGKLL